MNGPSGDPIVDSETRDRTSPEYVLHRVFVPIEKRITPGLKATVFRTTDREVYVRLESGAIRRASGPKANGKQARKQRALARKAQR